MVRHVTLAQLGYEFFYMASPRIEQVRHLYSPHTEHEFNVLTAGFVRYRFGNGSVVTLQPGQVLAIPGGMPHQLIDMGQVQLYGVHLSTDWVDALAGELPAQLPEYLINAQHPPAPRILDLPEMANLIVSTIAQAQADKALPTLPLHDACQAQATRLLAVLFMRAMLMPENWQGETRHPTLARVQRVKDWIDRHYLEPTPIPVLAETANLSAHHFSRLFQQLTGTRPKEYQLHLRLQHAARLLLTTALTQEAIAQESGFHFLPNFVRQFKAQYGIPPGAYRSQAQAAGLLQR